jgi:putative DNA primase/helicase
MALLVTPPASTRSCRPRNIFDHDFNVRGTLEDWQQNVARFAVGNSRLVLSISMAFAAALIGPCGMESGGVHFVGPSSTGKTTTLVAAGSVWGGGDAGYVQTWRTTSNGLEATAAAHNDALLCLDELAQVSSQEAGTTA